MNNEEEKGKPKREILKEIRRKNYIIKFSKQENLEKDLEGLYRVMGELLYKQALEA